MSQPAASLRRPRRPLAARGSAAFTPWCNVGAPAAVACVIAVDHRGFGPVDAGVWLAISLLVGLAGWLVRRNRPWKVAGDQRVRPGEAISAAVALLTGLVWLGLLVTHPPAGDPVMAGSLMVITVVWWASEASVQASDPLSFAACSGAVAAALFEMVASAGADWRPQLPWLALLYAGMAVLYFDRRWVWARGERAELERVASLEALELAFDGLADGVVVTLDGRIVRGNRAVGEWLGFDGAPTPGPLLCELLDLAEAELRPGEPLRHSVPGAGGGRVPVRIEGRASVNRPGLVIWAVRDLTEDVERERRLRHIAERDELTGLANRRTMNTRLAEMLDAGGPVGVLLIDVDDFKAINDRFGHLVGDQVLQALGAVLTRSAGPADLAARLGGDEFVVLLGGADAAERARSLARTLMLPSVLEHDPLIGRLGVTVSVGVAIGPTFGSTRPERTSSVLLRTADQEMYEVKRSVRGRGKSGYPASGGPSRWTDTW